MRELDVLDSFDLDTHGDCNEIEFWPLLRDRFPSYELLWRRLIVPLTCRIDRQSADDPSRSIEFRDGIPANYEAMAMAHYSVYYFLGRAARRFAEDRSAQESPEDVLFLLDSVSDNFVLFRDSMNAIAGDCGLQVFDATYHRFPRGFDPFEEIGDYRDTLLHNPVVIKAKVGEQTYIPRWIANKSESPLEEARISWRAGRTLPASALVSTSDLLRRLIDQACGSLEIYWKLAIAAVGKPAFQQKLVRTTGLRELFPLQLPTMFEHLPPAPSGTYSGIGSNTSFHLPYARSDSHS
jgi:hypothetical protein